MEFLTKQSDLPTRGLNIQNSICGGAALTVVVFMDSFMIPLKTYGFDDFQAWGQFRIWAGAVFVD